jgi:MoaA/NifB/PqqE/SkfB family radical SAM enzyme/pimeloyl-ACP methyl ester carboxylesterase
LDALGIVLVHGYTGKPKQLEPLACRLVAQFGDDAVHCVQLPGHAHGAVPVFNAASFERAIGDAVEIYLKQNRRIVLIGHSTGGCLSLGYLHHARVRPTLLILAGTPAKIIGSDLERWQKHRRHQKQVSLLDTARMVTYINRVGQTAPACAFPILALRGGHDGLVSDFYAAAWRNGDSGGRIQSATIPTAQHDLFTGAGSETAIDCVARALSDLCRPSDPDELKAMSAISAIEPGAQRFMAAGRTARVWHLSRAPAASRLLGRPIPFPSTAETDPVQLNIEITSRCNLGCGHCARSFYRQSGKDMALRAFANVLNLAPNTYKVVLVGLGEPTLHPQLPEFVELAAQRGHRVGLVTNAMALEPDLGRRLITAGLQAMTFSLDTVNATIASQVRNGTDINRIIHNIRQFLSLAGDAVSTAVFTAVSCRTAPHLPELAGAVADLGVKAWMLSDMNFGPNLPITLWKNWCPAHARQIGNSLRLAFDRHLPVLSVRGLEALALDRCFDDFLVTLPAEVKARSKGHQWCLSPWQTLPVDVAGNVTICDCQPHQVIGNIYKDAFSAIWNGRPMRRHRQAMRTQNPPEACLVCPRF